MSVVRKLTEYEKEDPIEQLVMNFCGENYGIRETHDPLGDELLTTKQVAAILTRHFNRAVSVDAIRGCRLRHWEDFYHFCVKKVNSDWSRQQIYYSLEAVDVFKKIMTETNEEIFISPNVPIDTRSNLNGIQTDDPIFQIMGKMLDVLKIYVSNKKGTKKTRQLKDKFQDLLEYNEEDRPKGD